MKCIDKFNGKMLIEEEFNVKYEVNEIFIKRLLIKVRNLFI